MAQMSAAAIPPKLERELAEAQTEEDARSIGMDFSTKLVNRLVDYGAPGVHIFTLNQHRAALELVKNSQLA
jgi:methylenetetrahydrofolate reductase (NADPH)